MPARAGAAARIGPNAVIQLVAPLAGALGEREADALLSGAGFTALPDPKAGLIPENAVARLFAAAAARLGPATPEVLHAAGAATGAYVTANRIPPSARALLRALPAPAAAALLARAIARNAWTFAGSGRVRVHGLARPVIGIADNPLAGYCAWHRGVFDALFQGLASRDHHAVETDCCARGAPVCRFEIRTQPAPSPLRRAPAAPTFPMSRKGLWR